MSSRYYDRSQSVYGPDSHCYIKLGITYVLGFGKHIKHNNEVKQQEGAGSAILK